MVRDARSAPAPTLPNVPHLVRIWHEDRRALGGRAEGLANVSRALIRGRWRPPPTVRRRWASKRCTRCITLRRTGRGESYRAASTSNQCVRSMVGRHPSMPPRPIVAIDWRRLPAGPTGRPSKNVSMGGRSTARSATEGRREMSAQAQSFEAEALGAFPALLLFLFLVLTVLGVVAHGSFT